MADGNQRGVGVRVFLAGDEVVKKGFDQIGDSGRRMWAQIAAGEKTANPALKATSRAVGEVKTGIEGLAARVGPAGSVLGAFGAAGIGVAAALGGLAVAAGRAREAMQWAADLQRQADQLGIASTALQRLQFAAGETDTEVGELHASLDRLNGAIGAMKTGLGDAKAKEAFKALGISREDLAGIENAAQLLPLLAERLGRVGSTAEQVQLARRLGIEALLPMLRRGADGLAEMEGRFRDLGLEIGGATVRRLADLNREMEVADQRIQTQLRVAFLGLAESIVEVKNALAELLAFFNRVDEAYRNFQGRFDHSAREFGRATGLNALGRALGVDSASQLRRDVLRFWETGQTDLSGWAPLERPTRGGFGYDDGGAGAREAAARAREAERLAREARQREARSIQTQEAADREALSARMALARDTVLLGELKLEQIEAERRSRQAALDRAVAENEITAAAADQARLAFDRAAADKAALARRETEEQLEDQRLAQARLINGYYDEVAAITGGLARTARERRAIELRTLGHRQRTERDELETRLDREGASPSARAAALASFDDAWAARYNIALAATMGPLEAWRTASLRSVSEVQEAFEGVAVHGLDALNAGLVDAVLGARTFGEVFGQVAKQVARDIASMALRRGMVEPISGLVSSLIGGLFGGVSGGGRAATPQIDVGLAGVSGGLFGGGRAAGGDLREGYRYRAAEHETELALIGRSGRVFDHRTTLDLLRQASGGETRVEAPVSIAIDARGADAPALARVEAQLQRIQSELPRTILETVNEGIDRRQVNAAPRYG